MSRDPCITGRHLSFSGLRQFRQWLADWNTDGTGGGQIVSEENMGHSDTSTSGHVSTRGPRLPDADTGVRCSDGVRHCLPGCQTCPDPALVLSCDPGSAGATLHQQWGHSDIDIRAEIWRLRTVITAVTRGVRQCWCWLGAPPCAWQGRVEICVFPEIWWWADDGKHGAVRHPETPGTRSTN